MALSPVGSTVTENFVFNSGKLTVGTNQLADVTDVSITQEYTLKDARILGSIKARKISRTEFKCGFKAKVISFNESLLQYFYGSSVADSGGQDFSVVDGQQSSIATLNVTCYIGNDTTQPVQYQFTNAVIKANPINLKMNDYAEMDIDVEATDVLMVDLATAQN